MVLEIIWLLILDRSNPLDILHKNLFPLLVVIQPHSLGNDP